MTRRPNRGIDVEPVGSGTICISGGPRTTSTRHHPYGRCSNAGLRWRVAPATRWTPLTYASQDPHGRTPAPSRRVEPAFHYRWIQESNCCVPRSICRCCNAMMVRIEPLMQQPAVCPICELYFGLESGGQSATMNAAARSSVQPVPR